MSYILTPNYLLSIHGRFQQPSPKDQLRLFVKDHEYPTKRDIIAAMREFIGVSDGSNGIVVVTDIDTDEIFAVSKDDILELAHIGEGLNVVEILEFMEKHHKYLELCDALFEDSYGYSALDDALNLLRFVAAPFILAH